MISITHITQPSIPVLGDLTNNNLQGYQAYIDKCCTYICKPSYTALHTYVKATTAYGNLFSPPPVWIPLRAPRFINNWGPLSYLSCSLSFSLLHADILFPRITRNEKLDFFLLNGLVTVFEHYYTMYIRILFLGYLLDSIGLCLLLITHNSKV